MARREDKAVAVGPLGVTRVMAHDFVVEKVGKGSVGHGRAGVARIRLLHRVHGERADGVDGKLLYIHAVIFGLFGVFFGACHEGFSCAENRRSFVTILHPFR